MALGEPQRAFPSLLVAGTNGKGSTVSMAVAILRAAGLTVGSTVSPHLTEYRERFLVDGEPISQAALEAHAEAVAARIDSAPGCADITLFELGVALALSWFAVKEVDCAVVEVGMGGEFDATRAADPRVLALTTVDMDHVRHLGPTILDIAGTKARATPRKGIAVVGETREDRLGPVREAVVAAEATLWLRGRDFRMEPGPDGLTYRGPGRRVDGVALALRGAHQRGNAAVAVATVDAFCDRAGLPRPTDDMVRRGLAEGTIAGRLETLPLGDARVLLDGAHNPASARALAAELSKSPRPTRRIWLYAAMGDKDRGPLVDVLLPHVDEVWCTAGTSTPRFADAAQLAEEVTAAGGAARVMASPVEGLAEARAQLGVGDELLVAGSLYLVGDVRPEVIGSR